MSMNTDRNRRKILYLLLLGILIAGIFLLSLDLQLQTPSLSRESGFYPEPFDLSLRAFGGSVYYTLDGSDPAVHGILYEGPLRITDASGNENVYSARTDTSTGFLKDLILETPNSGSVLAYQAPDFKVDKCTVIRAVTKNRQGQVSREVTATYFVGIAPEDYLGCNIISVITDPDNLFDPDTGIYVTGTTFENYLKNGKISGGWFNWPANYRNRGPEWERPVTVQIFDNTGTLALSRSAGIRVRGSATRGFLPRSLNLFARTEYDGLNNFGIPLFDSTYVPETVTLTSGGNAFVTQFNDFAMTWMVRDLNVATPLYQPYVLFLDGEYWGFYWLSEKMDESWFRHYYGVEEDNTVYIKFRTKAREDLVEVGLPEDVALFEEMEAFFLENDMSDPKNYEKALEIIDVSSCIDYYASMIYIARRADWPDGNIGYWRVRTPSGQGYSDGKWRWVIFDCNGTCMRGGVDAPTGAILEAHDTLSMVLEQDEIFASLWRSEQFRDAFRARILELANTCFEADAVSAFVDSYAATMKPIMEKSWARFYGSENDMGDQFDFIVSTYHLFFQTRKGYVENWFA